DISTMTDEQVFTRMIQETVPHEIGHTLGLRHNFKATADLKNIVDNADSTSVMDYEIDLQALTEPGPYDLAAIAYGYEGDKSLYEGKDFFYATDESESTDPQSNQWDAGDVFEFYSARFAHFRKLRDAGLFSSPASYSRSQRHNLAVARKFVNRDEASGPKAFDFLLKVLATRTAEAPFDSAERLEAMAVLTDADPNLEPLDDKQLSKLAKGLSKSVAPVGEDDFDTRVAMLEALKAMNNIYGRDAIASLDKAFSQLGAKLPARERELALRVSQALAGYFGK
ncbi:MAG: zinc-dependent metalloprotease, partial [Candidatus Wallbacteria bacterium]|nr:zinc-dependent metalloprotease [Candidatus Wallbacteria bacterium]